MRKFRNNNRFVKENFEELIEKYSDQRIAICNGEIFTGEDAIKKAREKFPSTTPLFMPVPGPDFLNNHLL